MSELKHRPCPFCKSLKENFYYSEGHLYRKTSSTNSVKIGDRFGGKNIQGYISGYFLGKRYLEHRLVWFYHYGEWPKDQIDHINGIRDDNRIENLREVTNQQNVCNSLGSSSSKSRYKGLTWYKSRSKWQVRVRHMDKTHHVGYFHNEIDAAKAYDVKAKELHKDYGRLNFG